jgi:hypothetical protein
MDRNKTWDELLCSRRVNSPFATNDHRRRVVVKGHEQYLVS